MTFADDVHSLLKATETTAERYLQHAGLNDDMSEVLEWGSEMVSKFDSQSTAYLALDEAWLNLTQVEDVDDHEMNEEPEASVLLLREVHVVHATHLSLQRSPAASQQRRAPGSLRKALAATRTVISSVKNLLNAEGKLHRLLTIVEEFLDILTG